MLFPLAAPSLRPLSCLCQAEFMVALTCNATDSMTSMARWVPCPPIGLWFHLRWPGVAESHSTTSSRYSPSDPNGSKRTKLHESVRAPSPTTQPAFRFITHSGKQFLAGLMLQPLKLTLALFMLGVLHETCTWILTNAKPEFHIM